jgi:hypothetical protein
MNNRRRSHPFTWVNFAAFRFAVPVVIGASSISRFETDWPDHGQVVNLLDALVAAAVDMHLKSLPIVILESPPCL